jgi:hypothetical protein
MQGKTMENRNIFHFLELVLRGYRGMLSTTQQPGFWTSQASKITNTFLEEERVGDAHQ